LAMGIVLEERSHLPELAARADAGLGARLRADPRADALEAHGSLAEILEAGGQGVSGVRGSAALAARLQRRPHLPISDHGATEARRKESPQRHGDAENG